MAGSTAHIYQSLFANLAISIAKGVAAFFTQSGSMLAETLHSLADCGNQGLLLLGVKRSAQPPDAKHPLGYGRSLYFWSFMVAVLLFTGGGGFSIYEGIHKLSHPEPVRHVAAGMAVLFVSLVIEGGATLSNIKEMRRRARGRPLLSWIRASKDSDLIVVFGENSAASLGLVLALVGLGLAALTGDGTWDALGSIAIGVVLIAVAVFLAVEVKSLLVGEAADPELEESIRAMVAAHPDLDVLQSLITVQQGPGEVIVSMKIKFNERLSVTQAVDTIHAFEAALTQRHPEVRWCFLEPG